MRRTRSRKSQQKCTFRNSGTPVRRTGRRKSQRMHFQEFWHSCAQNKTSNISKHALSVILGLLCAKQSVGNLNKCTFRNFRTPVRRTTRRKSKKNALSGILGLLCAEQEVSNLKNALSGILGLLCSEQDVRNMKNGVSGILGLVCAEQSVGNLKTWTF